MPTLTIPTPLNGESAATLLPVEPPTDAPKQHISLGDSVLRGALAILSAQPLTWATTFLLASAAPRYLGSYALGQYTLAFTITTFTTVVLGLGIPDFLTRRVAQRPTTTSRDVAVAICLQMSTLACGALIIGLVVPLVAPDLVDVRLLYLALLAMVLNPNQILLLAALRGREQHGRFAWMNASWWVLGTGGSVLALVLGADVVTYTAIGVALGFSATVLNWRLAGLRPSIPRPNLDLLKEAREIVRGGLPFLSWNVTLAIYGSIDRVLLGLFVPPNELGWYAAAYRVIGMTVFIPSLLTTPLFPAISRSVNDPDSLRRAIAQSLRVALLFTIPISTGLFVVAPAVPMIFGWPDDFANAIPLMLILSLHVPVVAADMLLGTVIMALGREVKWVKFGLAAAVFNIAANVVCIPLSQYVAGNGAIGAAIVTVLTELLMFVGAVCMIPRHLIDRGIIEQAARVIAAGLAMGVVGVVVLPHSLPLCALASAATYLAVGGVLRAFTLHDVQYVRNRFAGRRAA